MLTVFFSIFLYQISLLSTVISSLSILLLSAVIYLWKKKKEEVPLQAQKGPQGSRKLRFPDFVTTAQDGGKVVILTHGPPLTPGNALGTRFS